MSIEPTNKAVTPGNKLVSLENKPNLSSTITCTSLKPTISVIPIIPPPPLPTITSPIITSTQPTLSTSLSLKQQKQSSQTFACKLCSQAYTHRSSLINHQQRKHGKKDITQGTISCKDKLCNFSCQRLMQLKERLVKKHSKELQETKGKKVKYMCY